MALLRHLINLVDMALPVHRCYRTRAYLLRRTGIGVARDAKVNGQVWFYGRGIVTVGSGTWSGQGVTSTRPRMRRLGSELVATLRQRSAS
jgi:hypothetical protein